MNWVTHFIKHENRHGAWTIRQERSDGRFSIHFLPSIRGRKKVYLGNTRTAGFAIKMLIAGETRHPYEIDPKQCGLPKKISDWDVVAFEENFDFHWLSRPHPTPYR